MALLNAHNRSPTNNRLSKRARGKYGHKVRPKFSLSRSAFPRKSRPSVADITNFNIAIRAHSQPYTLSKWINLSNANSLNILHARLPPVAAESVDDLMQAAHKELRSYKTSKKLLN
jgi:hypothetical protein